MRKIADEPQHARVRADLNYQKVKFDNDFRLRINDSIPQRFRQEAQIAALQGNPPPDLAKMQVIHDYIAAHIQTCSNHLRPQIEEWHLRYLGAIETAKQNYMDRLFQKVVALVEAFNRNDFSNLTKLEDWASPIWENRQIPIPTIDTIPYDAARLPGITEAEYRHYFTKRPRNV